MAARDTPASRNTDRNVNGRWLLRPGYNALDGQMAAKPSSPDAVGALFPQWVAANATLAHS